MIKKILFNYNLCLLVIFITSLLNILNKANIYIDIYFFNLISFFYILVFLLFNVNKIVFLIKIKKKLLLLFLISVSISLFFIIKDNTNPLVIDTIISNNPNYEQVTKNEKIIKEIIVKQDNLGTILIPLKINVTQEENLNKIKVNFKLKNENNEEIYNNDYEIIFSNEEVVFPFGFPIQNDSINKKYYVELINLSEQKILTGNKFSERYVYSIKYFNSKENIFNFLKEKLKTILVVDYYYPLIFQFLIILFLSLNKIIIKDNDETIVKKTIILLLILTGYLNINNYINYIIDISFIINNKILILLNLFTFFTLLGKRKNNEESKLLINNSVLIILLFLSFIIKFYNLGDLGYITDEGQTAQYSNIINKSFFTCSDGICLLRGLPYIYPTAVLTYFFGVNELTIRSTGVLFSLFSIILLYKILKKLDFSENTINLSILLIGTSDWFLSFSRYARMYPALLFYVLLSIYSFTLFYEKIKIRYFFGFYIFFVLSIFTHQFGILLGFLLITPFLTNKNKKFLNYKYFFLCSIIFITIIFFMTNIPGLTYSKNYIGFYDINVSRLQNDKFWFLSNLQYPNIEIIGDFIKYFPILVVLFIKFLISNLKNKDKKNIIIYFSIFSIFFILIYKIQFATKYLWWILPFIYTLAAEEINLINKKSKTISKLIIFLIVIPYMFGTHKILFRQYGESFSENWLISPTHTSDYYVDDKTPVEFVSKRYSNGDIIISDYWMHDVYLNILINRKSNYFISEWSGEEFINRFPFYKLYPIEKNKYKLSENGPIIIKKSIELDQIIKSNKRIWIISSFDAIGRRHEHISSEDVINYLNKFNKNIVYIGKDKNSRVYLFKNE
ncbi:MAG: hypothetical protein COU63_03420 [Candidatus Pacebacteria bacterium CG10_big_fil_rev_8_21_14_0_10_36_11]|nr:MAG: hypothetical protein COU63_03420 [Candidatus Pacebacteria bacterium CG10_big_fil_rev_8_21_14_0_10_36_11]